MIDDFRRPPSRPLQKQNANNHPHAAVHTLNSDPLLGTLPTIEIDEIIDPPIKTKKRRRSPKAWFLSLSKKQKIIFIVSLVLGLVLLAGGGVFAYQKTRKKPAAPAPAAQKVEPTPPPEPPKPTTLPSPLTGVEVAPELAKRPVTGVMIENSPDARPQSGLNSAGVVFEAVAEGGITRFLALFQESQPDYIGPVRSARPYYIDWLLGYDAAYAHVGGSPEALALVKSAGVKDLDQFANSAAYWRISQRYAPHNVYTSMARLDELKNKKGYTTSTFTGFQRKPEAPSPAPTARSIDLTLSGFLYNVHYDYDPASNSYKRVMAGKAHTDEKSGAQLAPKVVAALVTKKGIASDGVHSTYTTTGSGTLYLFQDGVMTQGTWAKADRKSPLTFTDANGAPLKLNPGQTWVTAVGQVGDVVAK